MSVIQQAREYYFSKENHEVKFKTFYDKIIRGMNFEEAFEKKYVPRGKGSMKTKETVNKYQAYLKCTFDLRARNLLIEELKPIFRSFRQGIIDLMEYEEQLRELHKKHGLIAL